MKILLTGGAGYIGSHTYVELFNAGHEAVIMDNFSNSSPIVIKRLEKITGQPVTFYEGDMCDSVASNEIFSCHRFDVVIHFAGNKAVGESVEKPLMYYRNNIDSTLMLCEMMKKYDVKNIVFSSSATVYDPKISPPLEEDSRGGNCMNPYAWTKFMNEQILMDLSAANQNFRVVMLRYFNPVGAHISGTIGEDPIGIPNNLMPFITQVASGVRDKLNVFGGNYPTPDGTCIRDYIHVVDLAKGHVAACRYMENNDGLHVINLGTGVGYSVFDVIHAFENATGITIPYAVTARRPGDLPISYANPAKAKKLLCWKAEKTLDDMCRDSWRWQRQNPNGYI